MFAAVVGFVCEKLILRQGLFVEQGERPMGGNNVEGSTKYEVRSNSVAKKI